MPVLLPTPAEAADLLSVSATAIGRSVEKGAALRAVERDGRLLSGRLLVDVLHRAGVLADLDAHQPAGTIRGEHLDRAFDELLAAAEPVEAEFQALRALTATRFSGALPWVASTRLGQEPQIPAFLEPLMGADGRLDESRVGTRLDELGARRAARYATMTAV
jgi:hypothetical protein